MNTLLGCGGPHATFYTRHSPSSQQLTETHIGVQRAPRRWRYPERMISTLKWTKTIVAAVVGVLLLVIAQDQFSDSQLSAKVDALQQERTRLLKFVSRLSASRRVAQVTVLDQLRGEQGATITQLMWQEIGDDGLLGEPTRVDAVGEVVYFEAYVVKFDHQLVGDGDPDRGTSVAMFRRIFGDRQSPSSAKLLKPLNEPVITVADGPPADGPLWDRFWELVESPEVAKSYGVRVAQCEAPAVRVRTGQVWEVVLDAPGGINLRKLRDANHVARSSPSSP